MARDKSTDRERGTTPTIESAESGAESGRNRRGSLSDQLPDTRDQGLGIPRNAPDTNPQKVGKKEPPTGSNEGA